MKFKSKKRNERLLDKERAEHQKSWVIYQEIKKQNKIDEIIKWYEENIENKKNEK